MVVDRLNIVCRVKRCCMYYSVRYAWEKFKTCEVPRLVFYGELLVALQSIFYLHYSSHSLHEPEKSLVSGIPCHHQLWIAGRLVSTSCSFTTSTPRSGTTYMCVCLSIFESSKIARTPPFA